MGLAVWNGVRSEELVGGILPAAGLVPGDMVAAEVALQHRGSHQETPERTRCCAERWARTVYRSRSVKNLQGSGVSRLLGASAFSRFASFFLCTGFPAVS